MTIKQACELKPGIYKLNWKSGGYSLAAVGQLHDGRMWFAPVNWTGESACDIAEGSWRSVRSAERLECYREGAVARSST